MIIVSKEELLKTYVNKKLGIKSIDKREKWLPIKDSVLLSGIVGDLIGDGHIGSNMVVFSSKNLYEIRNFEMRIGKLFNGINYDIREIKTNPKTKVIIIFDGALVRILELCGVPKGNKVFSDFDVPSWIKNGSKEIISEFIRHLFDTDGSITFQKIRRIKIKFNQQKDVKILNVGIRLLNSIKKLLTMFDIKTTNIYFYGNNLRKDGRLTKSIEFEIYGTKRNLTSILNFEKYIGFSNIKKRKRLKKYIKILSVEKQREGHVV